LEYLCGASPALLLGCELSAVWSEVA